MKKDLRKALLLKRDGIDPSAKKSKETAIRNTLFSSVDFKNARTVLFYASFRSEVDTLQCIRHALELGKNAALPLVDAGKKELKLYGVKDISELVPGYMGIPEPGITENREISLEDIDLVVIPGAGFDVKGNRLGYGGGCYDRLLGNESRRLSKSEKHITTIALAFEEQIAGEITAEPHDVKVDMIITEKRMIDCKADST